MSADSWFWVFCSLVFVSLSPWGAVALTSVYVRARTLVLSGSLFVSLLVIAEVFLFQPGRFAAVISMATLFVFTSCLLQSLFAARSRPLSSRLVPSDSFRFVAVDWGVFGPSLS
jgi:hypothetical protein